MSSLLISRNSKNAFPGLTFVDAGERKQFARELEILTAAAEFSVLARPNLTQFLLVIYRRLEAERGVLANQFSALFALEQGLLLDYFQQLTHQRPLPRQQIVLLSILRLATRIEDVDLLAILLLRLPEIAAPQLNLLSRMHPVGLELTGLLMRFSLEADGVEVPTYYTPAVLNFLVQVIANDLPQEEIEPELVDQLDHFLRLTYPLFVDLFAIEQPFTTAAETTAQRFTSWFLCWLHHLEQRPIYHEEEAEVAAYFAQDFPTIVRYIPRHIWWNGGVNYLEEELAFTFGSPAFVQLAIGKSVRRLTGGPPYSRRMARAFVNLDPYFDQGGYDMFLYCFVHSLGGGYNLQFFLRYFLRRPDDPTAVAAVLVRWNPVIQKFADPAFENLEVEAVRRLLGYSFHMLRDQPDFQVSGLSIAELETRSFQYYEGIEERQLQRAEAERRRQEEVHKELRLPPPKEWQAWDAVRPFEGVGKHHAPYRKLKIVELTSETELMREGRVMNHCVGSYTPQCVAGMVSIWSFRGLGRNNNWASIGTVEIVKHERKIVQFRGRFNTMIDEPEVLRYFQSWAKREKLRFGLRG